MLHVSYADLVRDPVATVRALYAEMDRELPPETESAMTRHVTEQPRHKHGTHRYHAADFGLDPVVLTERFREYREAFGVIAANA